MCTRVTCGPAVVVHEGMAQSGPCREEGVCVCVRQATELSFPLEKVDPASCFSKSLEFIFVIYNVIFALIFSF